MQEYEPLKTVKNCDFCHLPIRTEDRICAGVVRKKTPIEDRPIQYFHHGNCCTQADKVLDNKE